MLTKQMKMLGIFVILGLSLVLNAQELPIELAQKAAESFSTVVFGEAKVGLPKLYYGVDNKPAVYVFTLYFGKGELPSENDIMKKVEDGYKTELEGIQQKDKALIQKGRKLKLNTDQFGAVMVSATSDKGPVIEYSRGLPLHYTTRIEATSKATERFNSREINLSRFIYYSPMDLWFEFEHDNQRTLVSMFNQQTYESNSIFSVPPLRVNKDQIPNIEADWTMIENSTWNEGKSPDSVRISGVPDLEWSYGCSPTASAMILAYWDAHGYSALVDYYFDRWDRIENEWDYDVPNVQRELAIAMSTDTVTTGSTLVANIASGTQAVCNASQWNNNYNFSCDNVGDTLRHLITEINNSRPTHWGLTGHPTYGNHSVCAMGWGPPDTMWIRIHDTWSGTPMDVVIHYNNWGGSRAVIRVRPPTYVGGDINTNTVWQKARSPYIVTSTIRVRNSATLTIEPGVVVKFSTGTGMIISETGTYGTNGLLIANGTATDSIVFTSFSGTSGGWKGIVFDDRSDDIGICALSYCRVENAGEVNAYGIGANIYARSTGSPAISNCRIQNSSAYGIYLTSSSPSINNSVISNSSSSDVIFLSSSGPTINNCNIIGNGSSYWLFSNDAGCPATISSNTFTGSVTNAVRLGTNFQMGGNTFSGATLPELEVIGGDINSNRVWRKQNGGYIYHIVNTNVRVRNSATLTIEPGVVVKFSAGTGMIISETGTYGTNGLLIANGTATDSIVFTSFSGTSGGWKGIVFDDRSDDIGICALSYCRVENAGEVNAYGIGANIHARSTSSPAISNCRIRNCNANGIYLTSSNISITGNTVASNQVGIYSTSSNPTIRQNSISGNTDYGLQNGTSSITINAENNWWGDSTGPYHPSTNPNGHGDRVSDYVDYSPWLGMPTGFPVTVSIPKLGVMPNTVFPLAVKVTNVTGLAIYSADITLTFDSTIVAAETVEMGSVVPSDWQLEFNATPGQLVIGMAGASPLRGKGALVKVKFEFFGSFLDLDSVPIHFAAMKFNDYSIPASIQDGLVREAYQFVISGETRYYYNDSAVGGTKMLLTGARTDSTVTNSVGYYGFSNLPCTLNYVVTPRKTDTQRQSAVSSYDAALVLRHVVGSITFDSLQKIAADVSGNGIISSYDAALILRYTVGTIQHFPVGDWTFRPVSSTYNRIRYDQIDQSYLAILYGDPSGNWRPGALDFVPSEIFARADNNFINYGGNLPNSEEIESDALTDVKFEKQNLKDTTSYVFPVTVKNCSNVFSADIILTYNPDVMTIDNVAPSEHTRDYFIAWTNVKGIVRIGLAGTRELKGNLELVRVHYQIKDDAVLEQEEPIIIHSIVLIEEQIIMKTSDKGIAGNQTEIPKRFTLMPNQPNPFKSLTAIRYSLPIAGKVSLQVYDASGRLVRNLINEKKAPGVFTVSWDGRDNNCQKVANGIYFYRLEAGEFTATKKMVKME